MRQRHRRDYGFLKWESLWNHAANEAIRAKRHNDPFTLAAGDVLIIPPIRRKSIILETGKRHRVQITLPKQHVRVRILAPDSDKPLANENFVLEFTPSGAKETTRIEGKQTDCDGFLDEMVPASVREVVLTFPTIEYVIRLQLSHLTPLDPDDEAIRIKATQERLKALGYDPGPIDGVDGPITRAALLEFQNRG